MIPVELSQSMTSTREYMPAFRKANVEKRFRKEGYLDAPSLKQSYCYGHGVLAGGKQGSGLLQPTVLKTWHGLPMPQLCTLRNISC